MGERARCDFLFLGDNFLESHPAHTWVLSLTHLQDPATDVPVTRLTFDAKLGMVVRLAVGNTIPARGSPHRRRKLIEWGQCPWPRLGAWECFSKLNCPSVLQVKRIRKNLHLMRSLGTDGVTYLGCHFGYLLFSLPLSHELS